MTLTTGTTTETTTTGSNTTGTSSNSNCIMTMDEERDYLIAASESLMLDYYKYQYVRDEDKETATTNDNDSALMNFFQYLHEISDQLYTDKQRSLRLSIPLMLAATLADLVVVIQQQQQHPSNKATTTATTTTTTTNNSDGDDHSGDDYHMRNTLFYRLQKMNESPRRRLPKYREQLYYYNWSPTLVLFVPSAAPPAAPVLPVVSSQHQQNPMDNETSSHNSSHDHDVILHSVTPNTIVETLRMHLNQRRQLLIQQAVQAQQQLLLLSLTETKMIDTNPSKKDRTKKLQQRNKKHHKVVRPPLHRKLKVTDADCHEDSIDDDDDDDDDQDEDDTANSSGCENNFPKNNHPGSNIQNNNNSCLDIPTLLPSSTIIMMNDDWKQVRIRRKIPADDGSIDHCYRPSSPPEVSLNSKNSNDSNYIMQEQSTNYHHHRVAVGVTHMIDMTKRNTPVHSDSSIQNIHDTAGCDPSTTIPTDERNEHDNSIASNCKNAINVIPIENIDISLTGDEVETNVVVNDNNLDDMQQQQQLQVAVLLEMINDLKQQLQLMETERIEERQVAQNTLQHERNVSYERIQALQLRLYICETRLQAYEEALAYHVESVQQNVATPPVLIKEVPTRQYTMVSGNTHLPSSSSVGSPLYARRMGDTTNSCISHQTNTEV